MARAQPGTIRETLLKVGCRVVVSVRWIRLFLSEAFPLKGMFTAAEEALFPLGETRDL